MYSVLYPELDFSKFSGMVPESILVDFPEWIRNGSGSVPCIA